ncbi:MAG: hypothetical protein QOI06_2808 [Nocardioidaceae bacterium]|jgi:hypothetical protein|nr:hypothetical protein [Nocardioidaceae bacterium]
MRRPRHDEWSAVRPAIVIAVLAIAMGCLFLTTYSLALGDPVPHRIDAAIVGNATAHTASVNALEKAADGSVDLHHYASMPAALHAIDVQNVYAALDLTTRRPTLYVASAAGSSVARVLERVSFVDPTVRVVDARPLAANDPNGLDVFYTMLVATVVGFISVFQVRANAPGMLLRHHAAFVVGLAVTVSLALTLVGEVMLHGFSAADPEVWGILALHVLAVASFGSLMSTLVGRWAILPTWLFFTILGNSASGGAVSPALLPAPFALISQWLPSGATVSALRDAVYFNSYQHVGPIAVLAAWAAVLFTAWIVVAHRREAQQEARETIASRSGGQVV